jgi:hypothetical protein
MPEGASLGAVPRRFASAAALCVLLLSGCVADDDPPAAEDGGGRTSRGLPPEEYAEGPETLYLVYEGSDRLSPRPSPYAMDGAGFAMGGPGCRSALSTPEPCWSATYEGPAMAAHRAGDPVHLRLMFQGLAAFPVTLEAWLATPDGRLAEGRSQTFMPAPGTVAPGPDGCVLAEVAMALGADVPGGTDLALGLRVDGVVGAECYGGGVEGSRLLIGVPAGPPGSPS